MRIISITPKRSISNFGQFCMSCVKVRACESGSTKILTGGFTLTCKLDTSAYTWTISIGEGGTLPYPSLGS